MGQGFTFGVKWVLKSSFVCPTGQALQSCTVHTTRLPAAADFTLRLPKLTSSAMVLYVAVPGNTAATVTWASRLDATRAIFERFGMQRKSEQQKQIGGHVCWSEMRAHVPRWELRACSTAALKAGDRSTPYQAMLSVRRMPLLCLPPVPPYNGHHFSTAGMTLAIALTQSQPSTASTCG